MAPSPNSDYKTDRTVPWQGFLSGKQVRIWVLNV